MNEQDFRDACAMLMGIGLVIAYKDDHPEEVLAERAFKLADAMLEARSGKGTVGLPPVRARKAKGK
jgi:hypothetical protein